jgi:SAM-dependent methyltransferase
VRELHGIDTAAKAVEEARVANPSVSYSSYPGGRLPYEDDEFDLSFAICVLHHVNPSSRAAFTSELARVVRPGGVVAIFEHNPLNPLTRVAVNRCEFDRDAVLLGRRRASRELGAAGLEVVERRYVIFLPFAKRWTRPVERGLAWLPLGAQYYVAGRKP